MTITNINCMFRSHLQVKVFLYEIMNNLLFVKLKLKSKRKTTPTVFC